MINVKLSDLNKRIEVGKFDNEINDNGFEEPTFKSRLKLWARVSNLFGREFYEAAAINQSDTVKFTIRYTNISYKDTIKFNNEFYDINHIDNVDYANRWIVIQAVVRKVN